MTRHAFIAENTSQAVIAGESPLARRGRNLVLRTKRGCSTTGYNVDGALLFLEEYFETVCVGLRRAPIDPTRSVSRQSASFRTTLSRNQCPMDLFNYYLVCTNGCERESSRDSRIDCKFEIRTTFSGISGYGDRRNQIVKHTGQPRLFILRDDCTVDSGR